MRGTQLPVRSTCADSRGERGAGGAAPRCCASAFRPSAKSIRAQKIRRIFMAEEYLIGLLLCQLSGDWRDCFNSTLTRRFAPPSPRGRGIVLKSFPLPLGEGGAKRRVRVEFFKAPISSRRRLTLRNHDSASVVLFVSSGIDVVVSSAGSCERGRTRSPLDSNS